MILLLVGFYFLQQTTAANNLCGQKRTLREGESINFSISTVSNCQLSLFSLTGKFSITPHSIRLPFSENCETNGLAIQDKIVCGHFRRGQIGSTFRLESDILDVEVYSKLKKSAVNLTLEAVGDNLMARSSADFKEETRNFTFMLDKFTKVTNRITFKVGAEDEWPSFMNINFDATFSKNVSDDVDSGSGQPGSSTTLTTTTTTTTTTLTTTSQQHTTKRPPFQHSEIMNDPPFDNYFHNPLPFNPSKNKGGKVKELQAEVESLSAEVANLNDTVSEEKQNVKDIIKAEIDAAISKIEKELDTLKLEDDALEQRLAALGKTQPKDDLDMKTLLLISILSSRQGSQENADQNK